MVNVINFVLIIILLLFKCILRHKFFLTSGVVVDLAFAECKKSSNKATQEKNQFMNCLNEQLKSEEEDKLSEPLVEITNNLFLIRIQHF